MATTLVSANNLTYLFDTVIKPRLGTGYVWGGSFNATDPSVGTDCSGAVSACLGAVLYGPSMVWPRQFWTGTFAAAKPGDTGPFGGVSVTAPLICAASAADVPDDAAMTISVLQAATAATSHMVCQVAGVNIEMGGGENNFHIGDAAPAPDSGEFNQWFYVPGPIVGLFTGAPVTLYGVDLSNNNWGSAAPSAIGPTLSAIIGEGFSFIEHKVSQGSTYRDPYWPAVWAWAQSSGNVVIGYHYVDTSDPSAQAANYLANDPSHGAAPCMLDFEASSGNIDNFNAVWTAFVAAGINIALSYIPQWYWQQIGSPDLSHVTGLVSSAYPAGGALYASVAYADGGGDNGEGWASYGGAQPIIWQFTDNATVAGMHVDADAYRGTLADLKAALGITTPTPPTPTPSPTPGGAVTNPLSLTAQQQADLYNAVMAIAAVASDIQTQLRGPGLQGWNQLGTNADGQHLTVVDAIAAIKTAVTNQSGASDG